MPCRGYLLPSSRPRPDFPARRTPPPWFLLDQWPPDMVHRSADGIGHTVNAALLLYIVVAADREQRGLGVFLPLRLDDVAEVDQLVLPGVERNDLGRGVLGQIRA